MNKNVREKKQTQMKRVCKLRDMQCISKAETQNTFDESKSFEDLINIK